MNEIIKPVFIPLSVPNLKGNELQYVTHAVKSEWVSTAGSYVADFEKSVANYVGVTEAVACQSGTAGLHVALLICGVTQEDMVIVPTLSFIASVNPVRYIGAEPVFMDCDDSLCMDPDKLEVFCKEECELKSGELFHKISGRRIPALVVVHIFGNMADMVRIKQIADIYHISIVEDAAEALGTYYTAGKYRGKFAGTIGDVGVYSFNGNKIITTGGGGMIVSNNEDYIKHARHLTTQAKSDELYYTHDEIGYNYRLTNLQAAVGLAQMEELDDFIKIKKQNYEYYKQEVANIMGLTLLDFRQGTESNHWFYALYCEKSFRKNRDELISYLSNMGVQSRPIWGLIHQQIPYLKSCAYHIETALDYWKHVVNIPCSTNLTIDDTSRVVACLKSI